MRKFISLFAALMIAWGIAGTEAAAGGTKTYTLDELGLSAAIPDNLIVFTRDMDADDPVFSEYAITPEEITEKLESMQAYLDAFSNDFSIEIVFAMFSTEMKDFSGWDDSELMELSEGYIEGFEQTGGSCDKIEIYHHSQISFLKYFSEVSADGVSVSQQHYVTVYDGKAITVICQKIGGPITPADELTVKTIVDGIVFEDIAATATATPQASEAPRTSAFVHTDGEYDVRFTVPAGWAESETPPVFVDAAFSPGSESGALITYTAVDVWEELTPEEQAGHDRSDLDKALMLDLDIAQKYNINVRQSTLVTYNGTEYIRSVTDDTNADYGMGGSTRTTQLMFVENGYGYIFQFVETGESGYLNDFTSLMKSVEYPSTATPTPRPAGTATPRTRSAADPSSVLGFFNILLAGIIVVAIYSLPIVVYRFAIRKYPVERSTAATITVLYGVFFLILVCALLFSLGGIFIFSVLLWSVVNYRMLVGGKDRRRRESFSSSYTSPYASPYSAQPGAEQRSYAGAASPSAQSGGSETGGQYCRMCGGKLSPGSAYCGQCGAKTSG